MTVFIGYSESLRMLYCDQSRLHGLISIALERMHGFAAIQDTLKLCSEGRVGEAINEEDSAKQSPDLHAAFIDGLSTRRRPETVESLHNGALSRANRGGNPDKLVSSLYDEVRPDITIRDCGKLSWNILIARNVKPTIAKMR